MSALMKTPLSYQQLTVSSSAVSLTVPDRCHGCLIVVESAGVRFRNDGTDPTSSVGMPLLAGDVLEYDSPPQTLEFIRSGSTDATLNIVYYA